MISKIEKEAKLKILTTTSLKWIGKNIFRLVEIDDFEKSFNNLKEKLGTVGYIFNNCCFYGFSGNVVTYSWTSTIWTIYVDIKITIQNIRQIFKIIDALKSYNGYSGTNEWKRDICIRLKIPMIDDLAYLAPKQGYWFCNTLEEK